MTEDHIERRVENLFDHLDARLMNGHISQEEYDGEARQINQYANALYTANRPTTYAQAIKKLPAGATVSCSFGYPGDGGYSEYHRTPDGRRFTVSNGSYLDSEPFNWTVKEL